MAQPRACCLVLGLAIALLPAVAARRMALNLGAVQRTNEDPASTWVAEMSPRFLGVAMEDAKYAYQ